jgi:3-oxoacyl-[acyl-carrier protein] reductase
MELSLENKTALVCGSTQGLGLATAQTLAQLGATVVLIARNEQKLLEAKASLVQNYGQKHHIIVADFNQTHQVKLAIEAYIQKGNIIHVLVNNSGGPAGGTLEQTSADAFLEAFNRHLICNQLLAQAVIPGMIDAGYGRILNIISTSVKEPMPLLGVSNTTRAAVAAWAKTLAGELGPHGITVNNVLPGFHGTSRLDEVLNHKASQSNQTREAIDAQAFAEIPLRRYGLPQEFANVVAFLASPAASYVSGINLPVDGGRLRTY